ncbi:hypothetical protein CJ030_MR0G006655 [Morella rubra]|uniref:Secreted protein n=1 Tax=Morella rubra TaxID=262757 RepID=A0A6A1UNI6_9ROSI|nr:hypothetical protein CJ030_MR0G006655 [Morella rubra]
MHAASGLLHLLQLLPPKLSLGTAQSSLTDGTDRWLPFLVRTIHVATLWKNCVKSRLYDNAAVEVIFASDRRVIKTYRGRSTTHPLATDSINSPLKIGHSVVRALSSMFLFPISTVGYVPIGLSSRINGARMSGDN